MKKKTKNSIMEYQLVKIFRGKSIELLSINQLIQITFEMSLG